MKKWIALLILLIPALAYPQGVRIDNIAIQGGNPLRSIPNAVVTICTSAGTGTPCTPLATTYTDVTLATPCPGGAQLVLANTSTCAATADTLGNYGAWVAPGTYILTVTAIGLPPYSTTLTLQSSLSGTPNIIPVGSASYPATAAGINLADSTGLGSSNGSILVTAPGSYCDTIISLSNGHTLNFGAGTYQVNIAGADSSVANVTWGVMGLGSNQTTLQSCPSSNKDVITSQNFNSFTGGANFYGTFGVNVSNLTIDGNKASEAAGYCTRIYGRAWRFQNVHMQNCYSGGLWAEWGAAENDASSGNDSEGRVLNVKTIFNGGNGGTFKGTQPVVVGFESYKNGCWGAEVDGPINANNFITYENDNTAPGTCGGIHEASGGSISGNQIQGTSATGWGMLVDTTAGSNNFSGGAWGGFAAIGLETRNGSGSSYYQGTCENENTGVDCLKINGSGLGTYIMNFANNVGHNINFASETQANMIIATSDSIATTWFVGSPSQGDTLILPSIPSRAVTTAFYQTISPLFNWQGWSVNLPQQIGGTMLSTGHSDPHYQYNEVSGCTTPGVAGSPCAAPITVTWSTAFADTNYFPFCSGITVTAGSPGGVYVVSQAVGSIVVNYPAITAAAASYSLVACWAIHN